MVGWAERRYRPAAASTGQRSSRSAAALHLLVALQADQQVAASGGVWHEALDSSSGTWGSEGVGSRRHACTPVCHPPTCRPGVIAYAKK